MMMRTRRYWWGGGVVVGVIILLAGAQLYLCVWLLNYVNRVLDNIDGYHGSVEAIDIHLYRGAYGADDFRLVCLAA